MAFKSKYKALEESQRLTRTMFRQNAVGVAVVETQTGRFVRINEKYCDIVGYSRDEMTAFTFMDITHPEDLELDLKDMERLKAGTLSEFNKEKRYIRRDGSPVWVNMTVSPMWEPGEAPFFHLTIVEDITRRKRAVQDLTENEEKFRSLFENSPLAIVHMDKDGVMTACNKSLSRIMGSKRKEYTGFESLKMIRDKKMRKAIARALNGKKSRYQGEYTSVLSGKSVHLRANYAPILSREKVTGIIGILEDITEQMEAEQERLDLEAQLRQLQKNEAIGALAGGIAHDFNNILVPIVGFAEMLVDDLPEKGSMRENAEEILIGAKRARELVKQILIFSRQKEQDIKPLMPHLIVKEVVKLIRATLPSSIEIHQDIQTDAFEILADPTQLHQVVMNLITNAFHAMEEDGGILYVGLSNIRPGELEKTGLRPSDNPCIRLSVKDTGPGIDSMDMERIFDPYFTTKPKGKGTGLGLSVVHGIVKNYGGDIKVTSVSGRGTRFDVYIPALETVSLPVRPDHPAQLPGGTERILLVDDEMPVLRILEAALERLGYTTEVQQSSARALACFEKDPDRFDLILTDMTMPEMTGDKLARKVRDIRPGLPMLLCTGFSDKVNPGMVKSLGIRGVLLKPVVKAELARMVRRALDEAKPPGSP